VAGDRTKVTKEQRNQSVKRPFVVWPVMMVAVVTHLRQRVLRTCRWLRLLVGCRCGGRASRRDWASFDQLCSRNVWRVECCQSHLMQSFPRRSDLPSQRAGYSSSKMSICLWSYTGRYQSPVTRFPGHRMRRLAACVKEARLVSLVFPSAMWTWTASKSTKQV